MRGDLTKKALELLSGAVIDAADSVEAFLRAGYGASMSRLEYEYQKIKRDREGARLREEEIMRYRQRCYSFFYKLKRDELIAEKKKEGRRIFIVTKKGKQKLRQLQRAQIQILPRKNYLRPVSFKRVFTIVIFDIPESEKRKRAWLRDALRNLGFTMLQKSVWIGKTHVPQEFLDDLARLRLVQCVEIFEISKRGTIEKIPE